MYRLEREDYVKTPYLFLWALLAFQAGFVNTFGFLSCGRYVSHVTGFGTQIGVALANREPDFALELLGFPLSFMFGSFITGLITAARIERGRRPHFEQVTLVMPLIVLLLLVLGYRGVFGTFGEDLLHAHDFALLYLLSFFCGMQNGCFAILTKGQIRTTHLTGISTDIGSDFARIWFGNLQKTELELTRRVNFSRITTFLAFAFGAIASVRVSEDLHYSALIVPLVTSTTAFGAIYWIGRKLDRKFGRMLTRKMA